jgi:hypothetical protein
VYLISLFLFFFQFCDNQSGDCPYNDFAKFGNKVDRKVKKELASFYNLATYHNLLKESRVFFFYPPKIS